MYGKKRSWTTTISRLLWVCIWSCKNSFTLSDMLYISSTMSLLRETGTFKEIWIVVNQTVQVRTVELNSSMAYCTFLLLFALIYKDLNYVRGFNKGLCRGFRSSLNRANKNKNKTLSHFELNSCGFKLSPPTPSHKGEGDAEGEGGRQGVNYS